MASNKQIEIIVQRPAHPGMVGDGFRVYNYFPNTFRNRERTDPFLMLDFMPRTLIPASDTPKGVDVHPHKGFETVTIAYEGSVEHYDSTGNHGVIHPGDVQWMTAGSGILHKEFHEREFTGRGGNFQMIQLWVNLPKAYKLTAPGYQTLKSEDIPELMLADGKSKVRVIAGNYEDRKGAAKTFSEMNVWDVQLEDLCVMDAYIPPGHNTSVLVLEGEIEIGDKVVGLHDMAICTLSGEQLQIKSNGQSKLLVLSGEPLREPIVQYGPFVMNTEEEIQSTLIDYRAGKFGTLD
jgi:redox-sensitive bicupin YhaK (pirin superfamily)